MTKSDNFTNWSDKWLVKLSTVQSYVKFHRHRYDMKSNSDWHQGQ